MNYNFEKELSNISDDTLRAMVSNFLVEKVPAYFWTSSASSSGKYHPEFAKGEGGLVRHTRALVMFLDELMKMNTYAHMSQAYKDYAYAAAILHDTFKYGFGDEIDKSEYANHGRNAAQMFNDYCLENGYNVSEFLLGAIRSHMGQWGVSKDDRPFTTIDRLVHLADYLASRSFIDIPSLHE